MTGNIAKCFLFFAMGLSMPGIISCNENKQNRPQMQKTTPAVNVIVKKPGSSFNDTVIIQTRAAIFYTPDSLQMQKIKTVNEKNIYDMLVHDCHYQVENARNVLKHEWPHIRIIDVSKARYLLFEKQDGSRMCVDLNNKNDICGLFVFDTKKDPVLVDMPNVNTVLNYYFGR